MPTLTKRPYDRRIFSVDLSPALREGDQIRTIDSITPSPADTRTGLVITDISLQDDVVSFLAEGGVLGETYELAIRFIVPTMPAQRCESVVFVVIE